MINKAAVITFNSGTTIITRLAHEDDKLMVLKDPMEMHIDNSDPIVQKIYLSRWLPFSEDYMSVIYKSSVESMTLCSQKFTDIYASKLAAIEASKAQISDPERTEIFEGTYPDESDDESYEEEMDMYEGDEEKSTKTYH